MRRSVILGACFCVVTFASAVYAQPGFPHRVKGYIFEADGVTQVPSGTPVSVHDIDSGDYVEGGTSSSPTNPGSYAASISGEDGDHIVVRAFNLTHEGVTTTLLEPGTTYDVNVILDTPRANELPEITSAAVESAPEDSVYIYDVEAYDFEEHYGLDTLTFALVVHPTGMTIDAGTGLIEWNPTNADVGVHDLTVTVADGFDATDSQSFTLEVTPVNDPPEITSDPVVYAPVGQPYYYDVEAVDPDNQNSVGYDDNVLVYSLTEYPAGMEIDPATGEITWLPSDTDRRPYNVTVSVTDGVMPGSNDTQSFTVVDPSIPTLSEWGVITLVVLLLTAGAMVIRRGRIAEAT